MGVLVTTWRCWSCKHEANLNLPHDTLPAPRCEKCQNMMLVVAIHQCVGCLRVYGEGTNKPIKGYCSVCWEEHLAEQRAHAERLRATIWSKQ